ncbi:hypothetical protein [Paraburkholderia bonniea]|uniref:hypothetical protein n=1 Tax=Paraburkholderia bonniea TaxID=2152891 RepID=UPI0012914FC6|nr:hypothetical protein [Paraburkholderia bonniea]
MNDQETLLTRAPYFLTPEEYALIKGGGLTVAKSVIQHHVTLKALGFGNASIANMVGRKNGSAILRAVIDNYQGLSSLGYTLADIEKIVARKNDGSTPANVVKHHTRLAYLKYTFADIFDKATGENPLQQLETTTENPEATANAVAVDGKGKPLPSLTDDEIDKLLTISGGKFALDVIYMRGYDLTQPPLSFTSAQILRIASNPGGSHTLEMLWNRRQSLVDKGYSSCLIYSILKRVPHGGSGLLDRLDTRHSEFLALGYSIDHLVTITKRKNPPTTLQSILSNKINAGSAIGQRLINENLTVLELKALVAPPEQAKKLLTQQQEAATQLPRPALQVQVTGERPMNFVPSADLESNGNLTSPADYSVHPANRHKEAPHIPDNPYQDAFLPTQTTPPVENQQTRQGALNDASTWPNLSGQPAQEYDCLTQSWLTPVLQPHELATHPFLLMPNMPEQVLFNLNPVLSGLTSTDYQQSSAALVQTDTFNGMVTPPGDITDRASHSLDTPLIGFTNSGSGDWQPIDDWEQFIGKTE